jgi:hypothetical protein
MRKNVTVKKFKNLRNKPEPQKKGITYSIEHVHLLNSSSPKGHIYKKYINGKLIKQVYLTDSHAKALIKRKTRYSMKNGGMSKNLKVKKPEQTVVVVQSNNDTTGFGSNFKSGLGSGLGFGAGIAIVESFFDALFDN